MMNTNKNTSPANPVFPILLIDDEVQTLRSYEMQLLNSGLDNFVSVVTAEEGFEVLEKQDVAVVLLDLSMPGMGGEAMLRKLTREYPHIPVIVVTAYQEVELAVECMKNGAFDFLVKPVDSLRLMNVIRHALEIGGLRDENSMLRKSMIYNTLGEPSVFGAIRTESQLMKSLFLYIQSVAVTSQPVLITGETGVGKELMAEAVHKASGRKGKLVKLNVAGLDDTTFSDTLFGHKSGAFTDARQERSGLIETAVNGTIFLDEIGDLMIGSQIKLLRLIQEKEYFPLGADNPVTTNTRIVTATNHNLKELIEEGAFRQDLYYRLNLHHVHVPSLRERMEDLKVLVPAFVAEACEELRIKTPAIPKMFYELAEKYEFPGNIRELRAVVYETLTRPQPDNFSLAHIRHLLKESGKEESRESVMTLLREDTRRLTTLEESESMLIDKALKLSDGNLTKAAKSLGVSRSTLYRKMKKIS